MKLGDYVLIIAIAVCFVGALVYTVRRRKSGGCMGCGSGGNCSVCSTKHGHAGDNSGGGCAGCSSRSGCMGLSSGGRCVEPSSGGK